MSAFDFKKEDKDIYLPGKKPVVIDVPPMNFLTVQGKGDPNTPGGEYQHGLELLYALCYTIKMSKMNTPPEGYFDYVMPPLEGLWSMSDGSKSLDYSNKELLCFTSMIRQPDFVNEQVLEWANLSVKEKKGLDASPVNLWHFEEGLCVQCMHIGSYDDEPATMELMERFIEENGLAEDHGEVRRHHEIYLGDPRRVAPEKRKTVLRVPVKRI